MRGILFLGLFGAVGVASAQTVVNPSLWNLGVELANLNNPMGIDVDASGRLYVADSGNGNVLRKQGGVWTTWSSGQFVGNYFGYNISILAVKVASDGSVWLGEGGRNTASVNGEANTDRLIRMNQDGTVNQILPSVANGGNWNGIGENPLTGEIFGISSNTDRVFRSSQSLGSYGALSQWSTTGVSPMMMEFIGNTAYLARWGSFGGSGSIDRFDSSGNLLQANWSPGPWNPISAIEDDGNGNLIVAEWGSFLFGPGSGAVWRVSTATGARTKIAEGFGYVNDIVVAANGDIYLTDMFEENTNNGRVYRLQAVPEPASLTALALGAAALLRRRRRSA